AAVRSVALGFRRRRAGDALELHSRAAGRARAGDAHRIGKARQRHPRGEHLALGAERSPAAPDGAARARARRRRLLSARDPAGAGAASAPRVAGLTFGSWAEVARWLDQIQTPRAQSTPQILTRVHEVAGATPDTLARIRMLAREVQRMRYAANDIGLGRGWGY